MQALPQLPLPSVPRVCKEDALERLLVKVLAQLLQPVLHLDVEPLLQPRQAGRHVLGAEQLRYMPANLLPYFRHMGQRVGGAVGRSNPDERIALVAEGSCQGIVGRSAVESLHGSILSIKSLHKLRQQRTDLLQHLLLPEVGRHVAFLKLDPSQVQGRPSLRADELRGRELSLQHLHLMQPLLEVPPSCPASVRQVPLRRIAQPDVLLYHLVELHLLHLHRILRQTVQQVYQRVLLATSNPIPFTGVCLEPL
mmetsp:Transcript_42329/g.133360  ORF Transcript_42329/g.133360 Transcript_42329/m.133360 type:complete len:252 (-) Transcript_42329:21-776(-)